MRLKALIVAVAASIAALTALSGCSSQEPYTPPEATPVVSSPAIGQDGALRVGVNSQAAPLAGSNSAGDIVGFDVDLASALADELGLKVEIVDVKDAGDDALSGGEVDLVMGVEQDAFGGDVWTSDPYLQTAIALFSSDSSASAPTADSSPVISVQTSSTSSWMAENEFGAPALVRESGLVEAFEAMGSGEAGYVAADAVRGTYVVSSNADLSGSIVALMQQPTGYSVAILATNTELQEAVQNALDTIVNGGMIDVLDMKWLGTEWDLSSVPLTAGATAGTTSQETTEGEEGTTSGPSEAGGNAVTPSEAAEA